MVYCSVIGGNWLFVCAQILLHFKVVLFPQYFYYFFSTTRIPTHRRFGVMVRNTLKQNIIKTLNSEVRSRKFFLRSDSMSNRRTARIKLVNQIVFWNVQKKEFETFVSLLSDKPYIEHLRSVYILYCLLAIIGASFLHVFFCGFCLR